MKYGAKCKYFSVTNPTSNSCTVVSDVASNVVCYLVAGSLLGALCRLDRGETYAECRDVVIELVRVNLERQPTESDMDVSTSDMTSAPSPTSVDQLKHKLANSAATERVSKLVIYH